MAQTQGTKRKVCYYYDGEHSPRAGGVAGPEPGGIREREPRRSEGGRLRRLGKAEGGG